MKTTLLSAVALAALWIAMAVPSPAVAARASVPADVTLAPGESSTEFGHSTVVPVRVTGNPADAGATLRWCVVPVGEETCWRAQGSVDIPPGDSTVWTRPLSTAMPVGERTVHLWYTWTRERDGVTTVRGDKAHEVAADGTPSVDARVVVRPQTPELTVSLSKKTRLRKDVGRKRVTAFAWAQVTGVPQASVTGSMAMYVDGRRVTDWHALRMLPIPGSVNRKPAVELTVPSASIKRLGPHRVQMRYRASGPAAEVAGTTTYTSLKRTFRTY